MVLPLVRTLSPATHVVQAPHTGALSAVLNVPTAQSEQTRSLVASPSAETKVPAEQPVRAVHSVAGSSSWSHVPSPSLQGLAGAVLPAQYSPGLQAAQTGGDEGVPALVWTVPGAQEPSSMQTD
jgi:hypothetical protein